MGGRKACVLAARQEHNARHRGRHVPAQAAQCPGCPLVHGGLAGALLACDDHVGLEQHPLERDTLLEEGVEHRVKDDAGDFLTALDPIDGEAPFAKSCEKNTAAPRSNFDAGTPLEEDGWCKLPSPRNARLFWRPSHMPAAVSTKLPKRCR